MSKEYIDREKVILAVRHAWAKGLEPTQYIEQIPAADVTPVEHGRWLNFYNDFTVAECDQCASQFEVTFDSEANGALWNGFKQFYKYYPNCGAKMNWINVKERLPSCEKEVLICCNRNGYRFVCPAIYEDGTMLTQDSTWNWYDIGCYGTYSEDNDDYFVPQGWWRIDSLHLMTYTTIR